MRRVDEAPNHPIQVKEVSLVAQNVRKLNEHRLNDEERRSIDVKFKNWTEMESDTVAYAFLRITIQPTNEKNGLLFLDATFRGKCEAEREVDEAELRYFTELQSIALLWPYMRQHVANTMTEMSLPPYILPTIDVLATLEWSRQNSTDGGVD